MNHRQSIANAEFRRLAARLIISSATARNVVQFFVGKLSEKEEAIDIDDEEDETKPAEKKQQYKQESLIGKDGFVPVDENYDLPFN